MNTTRLKQVIALLEQTISSKLSFAADLRADTLTSMPESVANEMTARYVMDVNIPELELIVKDLYSCIDGKA